MGDSQMYCTNCGAPFDFWEDDYCFNCGVKLYLGTIEEIEEYRKRKLQKANWMSPAVYEAYEAFISATVNTAKRRIKEHAKLPCKNVVSVVPKP